MTKRELNRDCKRLSKTHDKQYSEDVKKEIRRIYNADPKFEFLSKNNILILLRLNLRYREVQLHMFGVHLDDI